MKFQKINKTMLYIIAISLILTLSSIITYAKSAKSEISENILRLHIIANSNSEYDQALKIKVRDEIVKQASSLFSNSLSIEETKEIAKSSLDLFEEIALNTLKSENCSDTVHAEIGNFSFPTKSYGSVVLPSGSYDAVRIVIGEGKGENWWCVMYPPLCLVDGVVEMKPESKAYLKENLSEEEFSLITESEAPEFEIKFKLLELFS